MPMALLEEYFELQYTEDISKFWKNIQIVTYIAAAGFGIWSGFTIALIRISFGNKCFLFAKITLDTNSIPGKTEIRFVETEYIYQDSIWSHETICDYCQYSMVSSFIFATIWATFFLMCGKGGKSDTGYRLPQPWRIVVPAMIFNFIYFIIAFTAAVQMQQGTDVFCEKTIELSEKEKFEKCHVLQVYEKKKALAILIKMEIAIKTCWLTAVSWLSAFLIPLLRIVFVADFDVYKVCVYRIEDLYNATEEVLKIIDYNEPLKSVHFSDKKQGEAMSMKNKIP